MLRSTPAIPAFEKAFKRLVATGAKAAKMSPAMSA
jgi:hypothetical protein